MLFSKKLKRANETLSVYDVYIDYSDHCNNGVVFTVRDQHTHKTLCVGAAATVKSANIEAARLLRHLFNSGAIKLHSRLSRAVS